MKTLMLTSLAALAGAACTLRGGSGGHDVPTVTFAAYNYGYEIPAVVPAGAVRLQLVNHGTELHHLQLLRLADGHTAEEMVGAMQGEAFPDWVTPVGGPNAVEPGDTTRVVERLAPGQYVVLCLIPSADGQPHFMKGMRASFSVAAAHPSTARLPEADGSIRLADYSFVLSGMSTPGTHLIEVTNEGTQPHEVVLVRLDADTTIPDLLRWFGQGGRGEAPGHFVGGVVALAPGERALMESTLAEGEYGLICFLPDAKDGQPHLAPGMTMQFSVKPTI